MIPIVFLIGWIVIDAGPNKTAFAGVGGQFFGFNQQVDETAFSLHVFIYFAMMIPINFGLLFQDLIRDNTFVRDLQRAINNYGVMLLMQMVLLMNTTFMILLYHNGFDFSFKFDNFFFPDRIETAGVMLGSIGFMAMLIAILSGCWWNTW